MLSSLIGLSRVLACSLAASSLAAPVEWSPNGRWLAYTLVDAESSPPLRDGWLLHGDLSIQTDPAGAAPRGVGKHRVWATRFGTHESVLIAESSRPLSAPVWGPDGTSLAFGRFEAIGDDPGPTLVRGRYELVVQAGLDRKRSIVVVPELELEADQLAAIVGLRPQISPDGRYAAVPRPGKTPAVAIVQLDQGAVVKTIEGARSPSWAPDGLRLLFVLESAPKTGETQRSLHVLNRDLGSARPVKTDVAPLDAPPIWSLDGQSILAVAHPAPAPLRNMQVDLVRIGFDAAPAFRMMTLEMLPTAALRGRPSRFTVRRAGPGAPPPAPSPPDPFAARPAVVRSLVSLDREQEQCVALIEIAGQEQAIRWCNIRSQSTAKRIDPIDLAVRIASPSIAPDGRTVAFRVVAPGTPDLPAYCDLATEAVTLIAPDGPTRRGWLTLLARSSAEVLGRIRRDSNEVGSRPTILPVASQLAGSAQDQFRLRRMAKIARGLLAQPAPAPDVEDELRLFFDYLGGDFASAADRLDAVEARADDPDDRLRWLCLRAQVLIGRGDLDRARGIAEYVARSTRRRTYRIEDTPLGPAMTALPNLSDDWSRDLTLAVEIATNRRSKPRAGAPDDDDSPLSDVREEFDPRVLEVRPHFPFAPDDDEIVEGFNPPGPGGRIQVLPPQPRFIEPPPARPVAPAPAPRL